MTPLTSSLRLIFLFILALLLLVLFYVGIYTPQEKVIHQTKSEVGRIQIQMDALEKEKQSLRQESLKQPPQKPIPQDMLSALPDKLDTATLLSDWTLQGKKYGIELLRFKPLLERSLGPVIELPIDITLSGTFHEVLSFLKELETLSPKSKISNLEMTQPEEKEGKMVISTHIRLLTYAKSGDAS